MNVCDPLWSNVTALKLGNGDTGDTEESLVGEPVEHLFPREQVFHGMSYTDVERSTTNVSQRQVLTLRG
jgi:hypothetical protein